MRKLCARFPGEYWRKLDEDRGYPTEFVAALTEAGYLSVLIPEEYGGSGLGISAAAAILETVQAEGCNGAACHAQMYTMGTILRHGSAEQKQRYLPKIATGELRLQAFGVTEPTSGTDTTALRTTARRSNEGYVVNGQKIWTSRAEHSDLMLLLARTTPRDQVAKKTEGLSTFIVDMKTVAGPDHPADPHDDEPQLVRGVLRRDAHPRRRPAGRGGAGLPLHPGRHERRAAADRGRVHRRRQVVHRHAPSPMPTTARCSAAPSARTRASQFPIARAYAQMRAAELLVRDGLERFEAGLPCGEQANMAKMLAAEASWAAGEACVQTHGGFGFAEEYDVERKFRETRLYQVAPISTNLDPVYVAEHVLGLPRSY